ncbi:butyrophilin subfamily 3 member A2-like [Toxotes jaculatrix]|uniref:butyrophilin subfamily 3 member A2-like n=1 Tax=Toxotes jaculatrix TaxID=941984 RepID=UPI001B3AE7E3|nr:butyrophilin subfamily 3 member A2-like [Toxotes jaculatrix]
MFGLKPQLCSFTAPVSLCFLLLTCSDAGQSQVIGPTEPITVTFGDDITLPCHLEPAMDVGSMTFEWTRADLTPRFVLLWHEGQELEINQHPSYRGRTSLFISELKHGDVSLKLSAVKISDNGTYRCFIPEMKSQTNIELIVASVSLPFISFSGLDTGRGAVVLQCESTGWFPEPELLWLDSEGKLLSAGPTRTVRRPDDLYTVSSTVTVEQRHGNSFTCRVQQKNINQTRETRTHVPEIKLQEENEQEKKTAEHQLLMSEREKEQTHLTNTIDFLKKVEEHIKTLTPAAEEAERVAQETEEKFHSVEKEVEEKDGDQTSNKAQGYSKLKEILANITLNLNERKEEYHQPKSNTEKLIEMARDEMKRITEEKNRVEKHMDEIRQSEDTERQGDETQVTLMSDN